MLTADIEKLQLQNQEKMEELEPNLEEAQPITLPSSDYKNKNDLKNKIDGKDKEIKEIEDQMKKR